MAVFNTAFFCSFFRSTGIVRGDQNNRGSPCLLCLSGKLAPSCAQIISVSFHPRIMNVIRRGSAFIGDNRFLKAMAAHRSRDIQRA
jgi:hypothetical protein